MRRSRQPKRAEKEPIPIKVKDPSEIVTVKALVAGGYHPIIGEVIKGKVYPNAMKRGKVGLKLFKIID